MSYSKISMTKRGVELAWETTDPKGGVRTGGYRSPEKPLPSFADALQAFKSYVNDLLDIPESLQPKLTVTTVNLSDLDGRQGLQVSVSYPVAKCNGAVTSITTPLVHEPGENTSAAVFTLNDLHLDLITTLADEADRYDKGERVQLQFDMPKAETTSENAKAFDERAAAAEVASTRKPESAKRSRKAKHSSPADAEAASQTWNPDKTEPLTTTLLRQLLMTVERDVPEDAITAWTSSERDGAQRWAEARQQEIIGQLKTDRVPREPECVIKAATPTLTDGWTDQKPARPDAKGVDAIKGAAALHLH